MIAVIASAVALAAAAALLQIAIASQSVPLLAIAVGGASGAANCLGQAIARERAARRERRL